MAKLKPIPFRFRAAAGDPLEFTAEVSVADSTGAFAVSIPDVLEDLARRIVASHGSLYGVSLDRPRTHLRVTGATLEGCKNFIRHVAEDYLRCEVEEALVIVYGLDNKVTYVKDVHGRLHAYGRASDEVRALFAQGKACWHGKLSATTCAPFYQVGLMARVVKKTTFRRPSGTTVKYSRVSEEEMPEGSWLSRLNSFVGLSVINESREELDRRTQLPYTEEAARFFYDTLMAMCRLADRMESFFSDPAALQLAIDQNAGLLSAPKDQC